MAGNNSFWHWTNKDSFDAIAKNRRIIGLTEGRVYLSATEEKSWSVRCNKDHKIQLEVHPTIPLASRHPLSPWGIFKLCQWVTPVGTNITWNNATLDKVNKTLTVHDPVLEYQSGIPLLYGKIRYWGRIIAMDGILGCYSLAIIMLAIFFWYYPSHFETFASEPLIMRLSLFLPYIVFTLSVLLWSALQHKFNRVVCNSYT